MSCSRPGRPYPFSTRLGCSRTMSANMSRTSSRSCLDCRVESAASSMVHGGFRHPLCWNSSFARLFLKSDYTTPPNVLLGWLITTSPRRISRSVGRVGIPLPIPNISPNSSPLNVSACRWPLSPLHSYRRRRPVVGNDHVVFFVNTVPHILLESSLSWPWSASAVHLKWLLPPSSHDAEHRLCPPDIARSAEDAWSSF